MENQAEKEFSLTADLVEAFWDQYTWKHEDTVRLTATKERLSRQQMVHSLPLRVIRLLSLDLKYPELRSGTKARGARGGEALETVIREHRMASENYRLAHNAGGS